MMKNIKIQQILISQVITNKFKKIYLQILIVVIQIIKKILMMKQKIRMKIKKRILKKYY